MPRLHLKTSRPDGIPRSLACKAAQRGLRSPNALKLARLYLNDPWVVVVGIGTMDDYAAKVALGASWPIDDLAAMYAMCDGDLRRPVRGMWFGLEYAKTPAVLVLPDYQKTTIAKHHGLC